jgi:biotin-(acetyl-CoA carboxylase) ligase
VFTVLRDFGEVGFSPYRTEWQRFDVLAGREIDLQMADRTIAGTARGVGPDGTLLIERDGVTTPHLAGHIVMRPQI